MLWKANQISVKERASRDDASHRAPILWGYDDTRCTDRRVDIYPRGNCARHRQGGCISHARSQQLDHLRVLLDQRGRWQLYWRSDIHSYVYGSDTPRVITVYIFGIPRVSIEPGLVCWCIDRGHIARPARYRRG